MVGSPFGLTPHLAAKVARSAQSQGPSVQLRSWHRGPPSDLCDRVKQYLTLAGAAVYEMSLLRCSRMLCCAPSSDYPLSLPSRRYTRYYKREVQGSHLDIGLSPKHRFPAVAIVTAISLRQFVICALYAVFDRCCGQAVMSLPRERCTRQNPSTDADAHVTNADV
jgi:hypothetical protein